MMAKAMGMFVIGLMRIHDRIAGIALSDCRSAQRHDADNAQATEHKHEDGQNDSNDLPPHSQPRWAGTRADRQPSPFSATKHTESIDNLRSLRLDPDQWS